MKENHKLVVCSQGAIPIRRTFTLMEVLVASAIIGIFLCVTLSGFSVNMKNAKIANDYTTAIELAQFKINELLTMKALKEAEKNGDFGEQFQEFKWRTSVKKNTAGKAWLIQAEIIWGAEEEKRVYTVNTMILPEAGKAKNKADSLSSPSQDSSAKTKISNL